MPGFRAGIVPAAAVLASLVALPAAAQQMGGASHAPSAGVAASGVDTSDATVGRVGVALRQVAQIKQTYSQQLQSAKTPAQQQSISKQADGAAISAITQQGLTLDQYNGVIQAAQTDPALKQRVLAAAGVTR